MIKGIDISSHDINTGTKLTKNTESCYKDSDFVIIKATQGLTYAFKSFEALYNRAKSDGKLLGCYHYAGGNSPTKEAEYFYNTIKSHIGECIPCLDFEEYQNKAWDDLTWARKFVDQFVELSGVPPLIYVNASNIYRVGNLVSDCGLWVAGYPTNNNSWDIPTFKYNISPWKTYTIWQYSSSNEKTDRNIAKLTAETWNKIAQGVSAKNDSNTGNSDDTSYETDNPIVMLQQWLNYTYSAGLNVDGIYGNKTRRALIRAYQTELNKQFDAGLAVDGIVGRNTISAAVNVRKGSQGNLTIILQFMLYIVGMNITMIDGIFGDETYQVVLRFQLNNDLQIDGIVGISTWNCLLNLV